LIDNPISHGNTRLIRLSRAYLGLGSIYWSQNKPKQALAAYQRAMTIAPDNKEAFTRLGNFYLAEDQPEKAVILYRQAARRNLNLAWPHLRLGRLYLEQVRRP